ncbi:GNAT family N-acetyltransferase [Adhaeribacter arboris]|uniref:GNAT family N-acetyltransferase n=1 Tax=Adhaeribacter arboris TaxID=2072846 RepID=A0A2T2YD19_9BACT|nr:GNAT family protein [Adhaeribacter arboris]PSR53338.1 GNAT family N-acetyltransferase [Adhaeribacter arboris]
MHLTLTTCTIRYWQLGDELALAKHANNYNIWINLRNSFPYPYTLQDAQNWIILANAIEPVTNFALEVNGEAVGGIGLVLQPDVYSKSAEIGYWLSEIYWNRGIVTEALKAMTKYGFEILKLERMYAAVFDWNLKSARVLEKAGYHFEGKLLKSVYKNGQLIDSLLYATTKE